MMLEHLLEELQRDLKLNRNSQKDPEGFYAFQLSKELVIQMKELDLGFYVRSIISPLHEANEGLLDLYLMRANFLGQGTGDAAIGLDSSKRCYILAKRFYEDLNYRQFKEQLEVFANYLDYWMKKIPELQQQK